jgi:uncharacterized membrane protein
VVTLRAAGEETWILIEPNRSASWRANRWVIALLSIWCSAIAFFFWSLGLWPVIPFLGLEVVAVAAGLYYVCWKLRYRHVLRFAASEIVVEKGTYYPRFRWRLPRDKASLSVAVPAHPWDPLTIELCSPRERITLGDFLNKAESQRLLVLLRQQGLPVRNHSSLTGFRP